MLELKLEGLLPVQTSSGINFIRSLECKYWPCISDKLQNCKVKGKPYEISGNYQSYSKVVREMVWGLQEVRPQVHNVETKRV